jgi:pyruvate dehydrogenase kinase 2/3/4
MPSIKEVRSWYVQSFKDLKTFDSLVTKENSEFVEVVNKILDRHKDTFLYMGKGVYQLKKELSQTTFAGVSDLSEFVDIHLALDDFYTRRIGLRILLEQHVGLDSQVMKKDDEYVGIIQKHCSPSKVIHSAVETASLLCARFHGSVPNVKILGREDLTFPFIESHLFYILFELLKNSMRATVEFHQNSVKTPGVNNFQVNNRYKHCDWRWGTRYDH